MDPEFSCGPSRRGDLVPFPELSVCVGISHRLGDYTPIKTEPRMDDRVIVPFKPLIEVERSLECRVFACLLRFSKNTVQRTF